MLERERGARTLRNAVRRGMRHPAWLRETVRTRLRARTAVDASFSLRRHPEHLTGLKDAVTSAYGITEAEYRTLRSRVRIPPAPFDSPWSGGDAILGLTGTVTLLNMPATVLE